MRYPLLSHSVAIVTAALGSFAIASHFQNSTNESRSDDVSDIASQAPLDSHSESTSLEDQSVSKKPSGAQLSGYPPLIGNIAENFEERITYAQSFTSVRRRRWEMERLFADMTPEDAPKVMALVMESSDPQITLDLRDPFFEKWGQVDGPNALNAAQSLDGHDKYGASKAVFNAWARADLPTSWAAAQPFLENSDSRTANIGRGVLRVVAEQAPDILIGMLNRGEKPHIHHTIRDKLVEAGFETDGQSKLLAAIDNVTDPVSRNRMTGDTFQRWSQLDPDFAIEKLESITDPDQAQAAITGYMRGWSKNSPEEALSYALENPDESSNGQLTRGLISQSILRNTPQENEALIDRIEAAGLLERYGDSIGRFLQFTDPETAKRFSERLAQPKD